MKKWYNLELEGKYHDLLSIVFKSNDIYYEVLSINDKYLHYEIRLNPENVERCNYLIDSVVELVDNME